MAEVDAEDNAAEVKEEEEEFPVPPPPVFSIPELLLLLLEREPLDVGEEANKIVPLPLLEAALVALKSLAPVSSPFPLKFVGREPLGARERSETIKSLGW